jgi:hypothetical protein
MIVRLSLSTYLGVELSSIGFLRTDVTSKNIALHAVNAGSDALGSIRSDIDQELCALTNIFLGYVFWYCQSVSYSHYRLKIV